MSNESVSTKPEHVLKDFEGTYVGFGPSDESEIGIAELSITINDQSLTARYATGLEIQVTETSVEDITEILIDESIARLGTEPDEIPNARVFVTKILPTNNVVEYIFMGNSGEPEAPTLLVIGSMGDILGPTMLFSPTQVEQGYHERAFKKIEESKEAVGAMPRLDNNGLAPRNLPKIPG